MGKAVSRTTRIRGLVGRILRYGPSEFTNQELTYLAAELDKPIPRTACESWVTDILNPTLQELGKRLSDLDWVDVRERQPDHEQLCLVYLDLPEDSDHLQFCKARWIQTGSGGLWISAEFKGCEVTHWKSLVAPTKE